MTHRLMFCPNCGKAEQLSETYCRQCGTFLPDLFKPTRQPQKPEQHLKVNTVLSSMTIAACFTLAILLWSILAFRNDTHPLIYVTAGFLFAMGIWHIQTLWRTLLLKKHLTKNRQIRSLIPEGKAIGGRLLQQPDFENVVPTSVTDQTTKPLVQSKSRSS